MFTTRQALPTALPVTASISTSAPTCSLSGEPPFTIFINWTLDGNDPISALMTQVATQNIGIEIRGPERGGRRIGPQPDWMEDDGEPPRELKLLRLRQGISFQQSYTLSAKPKLKGLVHADTWNLSSGTTYELALRRMEWRWLDDKQLPDVVLQDEEKLKELLWEEPPVEFRLDCRLEFRAE